MGDRSRLEIPVGKELKEKYDRGFVSCEAVQEGPNFITVLKRVPVRHIENDHRSDRCSFVPVDEWMLRNKQSPQDEI